MTDVAALSHSHRFLDAGHAGNERRTWAVIVLCTAMMVAEIAGGWLFGSIALIADGMHMSTHAGALLLAALAYTYARRHAEDPRFTFGTGKLGDLAGFTSAVILAMIALLIAYEAVRRVFMPVPIHFREAIPIAVLGLVVNLASAWLLGAGHEHGHHHGDNHSHSHDHDHHHHDHHHGHDHVHRHVARDNNLCAAVVHVMADAAVSILVIAGLLLARSFGWEWMDPLVGIVGAAVIASWAYALIRDTAAILLDMNPDPALAARMKGLIEVGGDTVADLHLWRLGPGHLGAIVSIATPHARAAEHYRGLLADIPSLSHVTVEVRAAPSA